jgi:hypothetical protein
VASRMSRTYIRKSQILKIFRPLVPSEVYVAQQIERAFPGGEWVEEPVAETVPEPTAPPDYPFVFGWGNNPKRAELKGKRCRILEEGAKNSVKVEFEDRSIEIVSRRALKDAPAQSSGSRGTDPPAGESAPAPPRGPAVYDPPSSAELPDGTPADPEDPKLKHSVQRTGRPAVLFKTKAEASKFAAALVKEAKEAGASVSGSASTARWSIYPTTGDPWGMGIFSKPKR